MYIPLSLRLTFFYALILGVALWLFGSVTYTQAEQRAYSDLDSTLSNRAASVRLGKFFFVNDTTGQLPLVLPGVDGITADGVSVEILNRQFQLLASTNGPTTDGTQTSDSASNFVPAPWDMQAARYVLQHPVASNGGSSVGNGYYSTISYQGQRVRVYTVLNSDLDVANPHIIQTARSEASIIQSLQSLRSLLFSGGILVLAFAFLGGWLITTRILVTVRQMSETAEVITTSHDFSKRVPYKARWQKDELARLAATLNGMLNSLQEAYQRQQRFIADASHELRAPITSIQCNLDLLVKAPHLPQEEVQAALDDARTETGRMGRLVNDLLLLAHNDEVQRRVPDPTKAANVTLATNVSVVTLVADVSNVFASNKREQVLDLDSLLLEVFRQYRPALSQGEDRESGEREMGETRAVGRSGPRLILQHITPARVRGNADQLKQALVALVDNACKYTTPDGSVSLALSVEQQQAIVRVSDTGIGIAAEDVPHIFERFYRADRARSREQGGNNGGSGLGLAIAQSIIKEHQGTIQVESTVGKGSIFTIQLPIE